MSIYPISVYTAFHLAVLIVFVLLRCHNIRSLETVEQDKPVERRFTQHRDKGLMLLLGSVFPAGILLYLILRVPYQLLRINFGAFAYHRFQGDFSVGTLFLIYPLLYILWELYSKWKFREEYDDYCASYSLRQMNKGAAYLPDDPIKYHKDAVKMNRHLQWMMVVLIVVSLVWGVLDLNEYAYFDDVSFHYNAFNSLQESVYYPDDFEAIYKVESFVTFVGREVHNPFYAFAFKNGKQILFRPVSASESFIQRAIEFSHLSVTSIAVLQEGG